MSPHFPEVLHKALRFGARDIPLGNACPCLRIDEETLARAASESGVSPLEAQTCACDSGIWPERYVRNTQLFNATQQARLLRANVLLVGLGGLGGHLLDMLLRLGVGRITGADGDAFEESNLNRQILSSTVFMGKPKAHAAETRARAVNPAVHFHAVHAFLRGKALEEAARDKDLVLDALGGLADRKALHDAAARAGAPLISAGIAGFVGWVAVVRPGEPGPADFLGQGRGAEESLGNPAPTVAFAASLQAAEAAKLLAGLNCPSGMLLFDLADRSVTRIGSAET